jgi:hypothetical protein
MSDLLGSIGTFFSSGAGKGLESLIGLGTAGAGLAGNISAGQQAQKEENFLTNQQNAVANLTTAQLGKEAVAGAAPLDAGLVQAINNQVGGTLAEQGLAQAPGIEASSLAQAEAPYVQSNINTSLQAVLQKLGLPSQIAGTALAGMPKPTSLSPLLALLMKGMGGSGATPSPTLTQGGEQDFLNLLFPSTGSGTDAGGTQGDFDFSGLVPA